MDLDRSGHPRLAQGQSLEVVAAADLAICHPPPTIDQTMAEPASTTAGALSLKWLMVTLGGAIGSAISLAFAPAKNHQDAAIRFGICLAFTCTIAPVSTRAVVRWSGASMESIPDITLAVAAVLGIASWSLAAAIHKTASKHSDRVAEEGFTAFFKRPAQADPK